MKINKIIISLLMSLLLISCSQSTKKTNAKLKLNLSGMTNIANGIGNGGAILFGKSSTGEHFGKIINSSEENLELANGDWVFYAFMWEKTGTSNFSDTVYCAKALQQLNGTAINIGLNLTNANCAGLSFLLIITMLMDRIKFVLQTYLWKSVMN